MPMTSDIANRFVQKLARLELDHDATRQRIIDEIEKECAPVAGTQIGMPFEEARELIIDMSCARFHAVQTFDAEAETLEEFDAAIKFDEDGEGAMRATEEFVDEAFSEVDAGIDLSMAGALNTASDMPPVELLARVCGQHEEVHLTRCGRVHKVDVIRTDGGAAITFEGRGGGTDARAEFRRRANNLLGRLAPPVES